MIVNGIDTDLLDRAAQAIRNAGPEVTLTLPAAEVASWLNGERLHAEHCRLGQNMPGLGMAGRVADYLMAGEADALADVREPDGRVIVRGAGGPLRVLPGVVDDAVLALYRHSQCAALALSLSERSGWPVGLVRSSTPVGRLLRGADGVLYRSDETVDWMHAVVATPEGCLDVDGLRSAAEVCATHQREAPEHGPYRVEPLTPAAQAEWVREIQRWAPRSATEWALAWHYAGLILAA